MSKDGDILSKRQMKLPPERMMPRQWLEYLRKKHLPDTPFVVSKSHLEWLLSNLPDDARENARRVWLGRHGRSTYAILDELMDRYINEAALGMTQAEFQVTRDVLFAVLPTYDFNGFAGFTPRGDRILILHWGLGMTFSFWSHWYLRLHEEGNSYITRNEERLFETLRYFARFWYDADPGPQFPDIYPRTQDSWELDEAMTRGAISFVLGHEIGHIIQRHRAYGRDQSKNHPMEFEADRKGLEVAIRLAFFSTATLDKDNYFTKFILFGPLFATAVMSLFGDQPSSTHPSPTIRKERLLLAYEPILRCLFKDKYDLMVTETDEDLFNMLRRNADNLFSLFSMFRKTFADITKAFPKDISWLQKEVRVT